MEAIPWLSLPLLRCGSYQGISYHIRPVCMLPWIFLSALMSFSTQKHFNPFTKVCFRFKNAKLVVFTSVFTFLMDECGNIKDIVCVCGKKDWYTLRKRKVKKTKQNRGFKAAPDADVLGTDMGVLPLMVVEDPPVLPPV